MYNSAIEIESKSARIPGEDYHVRTHGLQRYGFYFSVLLLVSYHDLFILFHGCAEF